MHKSLGVATELAKVRVALQSEMIPFVCNMKFCRQHMNYICHLALSLVVRTAHTHHRFLCSAQFVAGA